MSFLTHEDDETSKTQKKFTDMNWSHEKQPQHDHWERDYATR